MNAPSIPKGTRDFGPEVMVRRNYIFSKIRSVFERYGYQPIETPSMENIETLTGKYGDEGDQLLFKILNSRQYEARNKEELLDTYKKSLEGNINSKQLTERALRYDLTVPFARFVVMNRNEISFPFKRYQIQPVWRADKPQRGRYREFYQCDVDVVGSDSLLNEVELVQIFDDVLTALKIPVVVKINNRKILSGIAELAGVGERMMDMTIAIDKLDKIGIDGVTKELRDKGFSEEAILKIIPFFNDKSDSTTRLATMRTFLASSEIGMKGLEELQFVFDYVAKLGLSTAELEFDPTLARGLNYYTGAIFEVKVRDFQMGSICGGGRYDDLTGIFGLPNVSGVGISFGADRIYDVMLEMKLFPEGSAGTTNLLFANFGGDAELRSLELMKELRASGINCEIYPDDSKMKKQFKYADDKSIPYVAIIGEDEFKNGVVTIKNMKSGEQKSVAQHEIANAIA
jgi:histidyl-tRNA synthetase